MALAPRIPRKVPGKSVVKAEAHKAWRADDHVRNVKAIGICAATGKVGPVDPHHLMRGVPRGKGLKAPGQYTIPLCRRVHDEVTNCGDDVGLLLRRYGLNAHDLANALWRARGDLDAMIRIVGKYTLGRAHGD